jgi:hypothetical protein
LSTLEDIPHAEGRNAREVPDDLRSVVAGVVVDNDEFPAEIGREREVGDAVQGGFEGRAAIESRENDRDVYRLQLFA